jgi:hypothetical protein
MLWWSIVDSCRQIGSFSMTDYGNLQFPLPGVALGSLLDQRTQILLPVLQGLGTLEQQTALMVIRQYLQIGKAFEIGRPAHKKSFDPSRLKGEYTIGFRYFQQSAEQDTMNAQVAASLGGLVSDDYKRRKVMRLPDPDGEAAKVREELAEKTDPIIALYRQAHSLVDEGREVEAKLVTMRLCLLIKQAFAPPLPPEAPEGQQAPAIKAPAAVQEPAMAPELAGMQMGRGQQGANRQMEATGGK